MNNSIAWETTKPEEIAYCKKCGKKIWKFWHADGLHDKDEMDICAVCLFDRK